jgi:hypothetical protein
MGGWFPEEKEMKKRKRTKLVHEGKYVAEVDVELIETDEGWSPYLSLEDAYKLDDVRDALRKGDVEAATRLARVFKLTPVSPPIPPEDRSLQSDPRWTGPRGPSSFLGFWRNKNMNGVILAGRSFYLSLRQGGMQQLDSRANG